MNPRLVDFLKGDMFDIHGRMWEDIFNWDDYRLEHVHNYIQWVFPLNEESQFNLEAPLLDNDTIDAIKAEPIALSNIDNMSTKMHGFYRLWNYDEMQKWWATPHNHNFLRITRILKCLNLFDMHDEVEWFWNDLVAAYEYEHNLIPEVTFEYWKAAMEIT